MLAGPQMTSVWLLYSSFTLKLLSESLQHLLRISSEKRGQISAQAAIKVCPLPFAQFPHSFLHHFVLFLLNFSSVSHSAQLTRVGDCHSHSHSLSLSHLMVSIWFTAVRTRPDPTRPGIAIAIASRFADAFRVTQKFVKYNWISFGAALAVELDDVPMPVPLPVPRSMPSCGVVLVLGLVLGTPPRCAVHFATVSKWDGEKTSHKALVGRARLEDSLNI